MERQKKYKQRLIARISSSPEAEPSLRKRYGRTEKKELVVHRSSVLKVSGIYSRVMKGLMAAFALVGFVSILRPELRMILMELFSEAYREIMGAG